MKSYGVSSVVLGGLSTFSFPGSMERMDDDSSLLANIAKHQRVSRSNGVQLATENRVDFEKPITTNIFRQNRRVLWTDSSNPAISSSKMGVRKTNVEEVKSMLDKCSLGLQPTSSKMKTKANLVFDVKQCSTNWLEGCFVGEVHSIDLVLKLQELLGSKITKKCLVRLIGGCKVLLSPKRGYNLKDFIEIECVP
ncbi:hypothetical protein Ancab_034118 [Ancistrocladus abbreviatus]